MAGTGGLATGSHRSIARGWARTIVHRPVLISDSTLVINDVMTHVSAGRTAVCGMGAYHGVHGCHQFSHRKAVVVQAKDGASNLRLRAPYGDKVGALDEALGNALKR